MTWEIQQPVSSTWNKPTLTPQGWPVIDPDIQQTLWDLQAGILTVWDPSSGGTRWDVGPRFNDQWEKVST
jgi:hypothetical protein